jgi:hypothetical protein
MKKQIKKLSLNKTTISNLQPSEMNKKVGGSQIFAHCGTKTRNGNTCEGHNTCGYTCQVTDPVTCLYTCV